MVLDGELRNTIMLEYLATTFLDEESEIMIGVCSDGEVGFEIGDVWLDIWKEDRFARARGRICRCGIEEWRHKCSPEEVNWGQLQGCCIFVGIY